MEKIIRIANKTLTSAEQTLYSNTIGAVIKTIMFYNPNTTDAEVTLSIDGVAFLFVLSPEEVKILDSVLVVNVLKATGNLVNIHISGIQLEEA